MRSLYFGIAVLAVLFCTSASADDARDEAVKRDRKQITGKWQITALEKGGNKSKSEDLKKLTVVNQDDGTWSLRSEDKEISRGRSTLDPAKKPRSIDLVPTEGGGKGERLCGIYELNDITRKLCFAPAGKDRPTEFSTTPENQHILVSFRRVKDERTGQQSEEGETDESR